MDQQDWAGLLEVAELAALRAGRALRENRPIWSGVDQEIGREVKVAADKQAEALVLEILQRLTPYRILSEEAGWIAGAEHELTWAVDPLDGSVNYIQGYPQCAVSIALALAGRPVLGAVYCFPTDEMFSGIVGQGAWLNGRPIRVSAVDDPARGVFNTGFPARDQAGPERAAQLIEETQAWRKVRMIGSAAVALAYVAAGRADAYRERGVMYWDVAGGCALVEAAGGAVRIEGPALDAPLTVSAHNGRVGRFDASWGVKP